jgi:3-hydroxyisobutyrate dehydrogenase-like beta-hydroxyacid dehydrogenase
MMAGRTIQTAFVGVGSQGAPMAERLLAAGFPLTVWARRPEVLGPFIAQGAFAAASLADLASRADHVGICVVDDAGVSAVCEQLLPAMQPGSLLAIHSTILPESCERLAHRCEAAGISFVDAPVSGGGGAAAASTLTVMCGGTNDAIAQARPVFDAFAGLLVHLGAAGAGQRAKIVNNSLMAANMGLAHAALAAAEALGIDRKAAAELIKESSGRSFGFEVYARLPYPEAFEHGAALLRKDIALLRTSLGVNGPGHVLNEAAAGFLDAAVHHEEKD